MSTLLFPDNTVLINFAYIGRMDLLEQLSNGNGAWCGTVAFECDRQSSKLSLPTMLDAHRIFGDPLYPESPAEHIDTQAFRVLLAKPGDSPKMHLGEAETISIVANRGLSAIFASDDVEAGRLAVTHGISIATTWYLLKMTVRVGFASRDEIWGYVLKLANEGRGAPPGVRVRAEFDQWIDA